MAKPVGGRKELELAHAEEVFAYWESDTANTPTNTTDAGTISDAT